MFICKFYCLIFEFVLSDLFSSKLQVTFSCFFTCQLIWIGYLNNVTFTLPSTGIFYFSFTNIQCFFGISLILLKPFLEWHLLQVKFSHISKVWHFWDSLLHIQVHNRNSSFWLLKIRISYHPGKVLRIVHLTAILFLFTMDFHISHGCLSIHKGYL